MKRIIMAAAMALVTLFLSVPAVRAAGDGAAPAANLLFALGAGLVFILALILAGIILIQIMADAAEHQP